MVLVSNVLPKLTDKQNLCLKFIYDFYEKNRFYPSHREIAQALIVKTTNMRPYLLPLEKKGYLINDESDSGRNMRLTERALEKIKLMEIQQ
jgi:Mn-dependent DtxR family transcriptional regulator